MPISAPTPDLDCILEAALGTARRAGAILMDKFQRLERVEKKGIVDLVTEADLASEKAIVSTLRRAFPDHAIIAEEGDYPDVPERDPPGRSLRDDQSAPSPHRWVIDPLDGTTNYVHGLPIFAVSIG
ncbi:MAG: hypothetical protein GH143_07750, partial [Calditrichaeota bacterium]|nr:hypothetical protein [Calditrichota bacterium]